MVWQRRLGLALKLVFLGAGICSGSSMLSAQALPDAASLGQTDAGVGTENLRILLVPLDDRPATTQFAQMIGKIGGAQVETPPIEYLGHFTQPGNPEKILAWMQAQDLSKYKAVILSTDMIAYGGLIASRLDGTGYRTAIQRLRSVQKLRREHKNTRFFAFSSIMRLAPTAVANNAAWRGHLAQFVELKCRPESNHPGPILKKLAALKAKIPTNQIERYYQARLRDHMVQQELVRMVSVGVFDYLVLGQDDATLFGPHVAETARLNQMVNNLKIAHRVYFCEGIDQHSNVLISRAILEAAHWVPRVRIVYADELGRHKIALYEATHVEASLKDQLFASGARPALAGESFDFSLYVNTPEPRMQQFNRFVTNLKSEIDQGFPVAVADINLGKTGTGDPLLFDALVEDGRSMRLIAYAGWNTAGNTMGTAIPAANVYLCARRLPVDPLMRELNQRAFLLHRLVNDFEYHRFTRPKAYDLLANTPGATKEETYGPGFVNVNSFVRRDMSERLEETFRTQFQGRRFFAGNRQYEMNALRDLDIELPWPRAYEVRIGFRLEAIEVPTDVMTLVEP